MTGLPPRVAYRYSELWLRIELRTSGSIVEISSMKEQDGVNVCDHAHLDDPLRWYDASIDAVSIVQGISDAKTSARKLIEEAYA
ncbi:hypothetical protein ACLOJK_013962 [Asimina triloba]